MGAQLLSVVACGSTKYLALTCVGSQFGVFDGRRVLAFWPTQVRHGSVVGFLRRASRARLLANTGSSWIGGWLPTSGIACSLFGQHRFVMDRWLASYVGH